MYINKEQQDEMIRLMFEYLDLSNDGEKITNKTNQLMNKFFGNYVDLIIKGVIHMPQYKFYRFAELEDLIQEGRMAILQSIHKRQWDIEKGNIFTFFTTVISRNLINYTRKLNKNITSETDIFELYNNEDMTYRQNFDKDFLITFAFQEIKKFFKGKNKFIQLTNLLEHYYHNNTDKRFIKKHFIEFAKAYNFSPAITNTFFAYIKRMSHIKNKSVQDIINGN
jgi:DNA-directed RNA polymerase specialized sigma subunit